MDAAKWKHNRVWKKENWEGGNYEDGIQQKTEKHFTAAVTAGVYLSFRYLLPLVFPFLAAYLMALFSPPVCGIS